CVCVRENGPAASTIAPPKRLVPVRTGWLYESFSRVQADAATDLLVHAGWPKASHHGYGLAKSDDYIDRHHDDDGDGGGNGGGGGGGGGVGRGFATTGDDTDDQQDDILDGVDSTASDARNCGELAELRPTGIIRGPSRRGHHPTAPPAYHLHHHHLHRHLPYQSQQQQHHHHQAAHHHYRVTFDERPLAPHHPLEMESVGHHVAVPLRVGGKKMRKRRELDALVAHSLAKGSKGGGRHAASNGVASHDQLLSNSTDEQEDYSWQPKVRTQSRCRTKRFSCLRTCGPLLFVSCIFISLGFMYWLYFDIRQQISQYRIRIEQVSATSQNVPEALQKWHETSKNLEQNQTALNGKLRDMQQVLTNFFAELKQLRETIDKKNENSQEAQLNRLQSSVADLGSNIGDSNSRIGLLETRFDTIQADQKQLNKTLDDLQKLFGHIQNSTSMTDIIGGDGLAKGVEKTIAELRDQLTGQLNNLAQNVTGELQVLKQKNVWLDSDLANQTKRIEQLFDNTVNISSHVLSIEAVWLEVRNNISVLEADRKLVNDQLAALANVTTGLHGTIEKVQEECQQYHSKLDEVRGRLGELQDQIQQNAARKEASMHRPQEANGTDKVNKDNMPPVLSQFFDEQQSAGTLSVRTDAPKPTTASSAISSSSSTTTAMPPLTKLLYQGTLVQQPPTVPQPPAPSSGSKDETAAVPAANPAGSISKKSAGLFDSVM
uniref:Uncharacterized protein n=1 Tax=Anopheles dirus TaxID=7168 RepID=A0A182NJC3_9DIPT